LIDLETKWVEVEEQEFSSSVIDIFCMLVEPMAFVRMISYLDLAKSDEETFMMIYGRAVIGKCIRHYTEQIFESFMDEFPIEKKKTKKRFRDIFDLNKKLPQGTLFLNESIVCFSSCFSIFVLFLFFHFFSVDFFDWLFFPFFLMFFRFWLIGWFRMRMMNRWLV
jgi:hypothetical protein